MIRSLVPVVLAVLTLLSGCAAGKDAAPKDDQFTFVSPGGQTRLFYPPAERGNVPALGGDSLLEPGKRVNLDDYRGKVVVLNIWGSWCGPCRGEADDLQAVQDKTGAQGVQLVGIDVRDSRDAAADFVRDRRLTYPSIYDEAGRSLLALKNYPRSTVPSTIILDRQHRVAAIFLTQLLESDLLPEVQKIAAERP